MIEGTAAAVTFVCVWCALVTQSVTQQVLFGGAVTKIEDVTDKFIAD